MIELPEAVVLAKQINATLLDKKIAYVIANASPHKFAWFTGDPANYPKLLNGKTIRNAIAYGNHIEIHAGDMLLVINTPIRYHAKDEQSPKKHQLWLGFDDQTSASCVVQMWGGLFCFAETEAGGMSDYLIAKQKPSPLSEAFDESYFANLCAESAGSLSTKAFLATEQRIPGLGNGVLQDILWTAKIHPKRKLAEFTEDEFQALYISVKNILAKMTERGGRDTENDLFGAPGGYKTILSKNTAGDPCPACGTPITKEAYLGGSVYYCLSCQRL